MFDPSGVTLGQVSSAVRDFSIGGTLVLIVWKARGAYEAATRFLDRTTKHMDAMEQGVNTLLTNHLSHIERDLRVISGRKTGYVEALVDSPDSTPPAEL